MLKWLPIALGILAILYAIMQFRMTLIYLGHVDSPTLGRVSHPGSMAETAFESALRAIACGLVLFFIPWPKMLTYFAAISVLTLLVQSILLWKGVGASHIYAPSGSLASMRKQMMQSKVYAVIVPVVLLFVFLYFFGY